MLSPQRQHFRRPAPISVFFFLNEIKYYKLKYYKITLHLDGEYYNKRSNAIKVRAYL
jgi:hypothetical protein